MSFKELSRQALSCKWSANFCQQDKVPWTSNSNCPSFEYGLGNSLQQNFSNTRLTKPTSSIWKIDKKRSISRKGLSLSPIWKTKDRGQDCPAHIHVALWVPFESTKQPDWPSIITGNWITLLWITVLSSIFVIGPLNDLLERNIVAQLVPLSTGISLKLEWERVLQQ